MQFKGGKLIMDKTQSLAESVFQGTTHPSYKIIMDIATECQDGKNSDRCEAAHTIHACAEDTAKAKNFNLKDFV